MGVKVGGHGRGVMVRVQGRGHDRWSQSRGKGRGSMSGVKVTVGIGVRWSVRFSGELEMNRECSFQELMLEFHSNPFHSIPF